VLLDRVDVREVLRPARRALVSQKLSASEVAHDDGLTPFALKTASSSSKLKPRASEGERRGDTDTS